MDDIYSSIPSIYLEPLHLMHQKRALYSQQRLGVPPSRVTKNHLMQYLIAVHPNEVEFLERIGELEVEDEEWLGRVHRLFDD
jgi:hypothetical protein